MRRTVPVLAFFLAAASTGASPLMAQALPDGVTAAMVEEGETLYAGAGLCSVCHGPAGSGLTGLGPNLADDDWLHSDGSFSTVVEQILTGVTADQSSTGLVMPPKGGSALTDDQVRAVAAYVWSLRGD